MNRIERKTANSALATKGTFLAENYLLQKFKERKRHGIIPEATEIVLVKKIERKVIGLRGYARFKEAARTVSVGLSPNERIGLSRNEPAEKSFGTFAFKVNERRYSDPTSPPGPLSYWDGDEKAFDSDLPGVPKKVRIFVGVCNQLIRIAAEHGKYSVLKSDAKLKIHSAAAGSFNENEDDLLFDPSMYRSHSEMPIPRCIIRICRKPFAERTEGEVRQLCCLMNQIEVFQKYTKGMVSIMARAAIYLRFERGRVIIRKGHPGRSLYVVYSGSVAMLQDENDEYILSEENDDDTREKLEKSDNNTVLRKGDCFGKDALFKEVERQATAICLSTTHFLVVNLEDVPGLSGYLHQETLGRLKFLKSLPIFDQMPEKNMRTLAERSKTYQYLSEKIIERDSGASEFVFICRKGQCILLRKIERQQNSVRLHRGRAVSNATESVLSFLPLSYRQWNLKRPNTSEEKLPEINKQRPCLCSKSSLSLSSMTISMEKTAKVGRKNSPNPRVSRSRANTWAKERSIDLPIDSNEEVLVRVAQLCRGDIFGLNFDLGDEKQEERRSFMLISSGCEVIAIKRSTFLQYLHEEARERLQEIERSYPKDDELFQAFCQQRQWKTYREQIVSCLVEKRGRSVTR